jgi:drug/metabolite transporter (DMT)-like permease
MRVGFLSVSGTIGVCSYYFYFKERFGWGTIAGTGIAMLGVAVLFLV